MHLYFAYGSNMLRARLEQRVGSVHVLGWAVLAGYAHSFSKLGADGTGKGNIRALAAGEVHGVLYRLAPAQLTRLETFEGGYRQVKLRVRQDTLDHDAVSFEAIEPREALVPTASYLDYYELGMAEHALPVHYRAAVLGAFRDAPADDS
ncbi:gamma-glutamylcyclotransferase family protein [Haliangium ochraceum]|uniref:AIG2 family protein n=1 Tax=Haliangium ochraceum (strain DSM 14365 / JCM 11303 / SMP-2) TaxID=502025 RepID=D0LNS8_HALO1|nr:gamma-glutamylcyclotransferase family protein [Haliangium ochraceum]ACY16983.1 AIG2 family protein [Haliangium ochraceum DSM 14365]